MRIKNKLYVFSSGLSFYTEKITFELTEKAKEGWQFKKIAPLNFIVYEKTEPEEKQFAIDFYSGKKSEVDEYIEIYQEAGWKNFYNYKKRYYFFEAKPGVLPIYSDSESFIDRIKKERRWLFLYSLWGVPVGLLCYFLLGLIPTKNEFISNMIFYIQAFLMGLFTFMPLSYLINIIFNNIRYKRRPEYFKTQEKLGKIQAENIQKDMLMISFIALLLGLIVGLIVGFLAID